jgi:hypothetical protein
MTLEASSKPAYCVILSVSEGSRKLENWKGYILRCAQNDKPVQQEVVKWLGG